MNNERPPITPPGLCPGDAIAFVSPAGVPDPQRIGRARQHLEGLGYRVIQYRDVSHRRGYLAGDDKARAEELMRAFADPDAKAIFATRGGYGCVRLLDRLDYGLIRSHPKILVGFSDITALHAALWKKCGLVTFHGPHPNDGFGHPDGLSAAATQSFWQALSADQQSDDGYELSLSVESGDAPPLHQNPLSAVPGMATGRLLGGNLALVCSLLGTPFELDYTKCVLFLEDIDEPPYRIDRFLAQLKLAGKFQELNGIVLGQFTNCNAGNPAQSLSYEEVLSDYLGSFARPRLSGFPAGHVRENHLLPFGATVEVDTKHRRLRVLQRTVANP